MDFRLLTILLDYLAINSYYQRFNSSSEMDPVSLIPVNFEIVVGLVEMVSSLLG
jgi:hypothetical protein